MQNRRNFLGGLLAVVPTIPFVGRIKPTDEIETKIPHKTLLQKSGNVDSRIALPAQREIISYEKENILRELKRLEGVTYNRYKRGGVEVAASVWMDKRHARANRKDFHDKCMCVLATQMARKIEDSGAKTFSNFNMFEFEDENVHRRGGVGYVCFCEIGT